MSGETPGEGPGRRPGLVTISGDLVGKRANIRATARAAQTLVAHAERDELVSRGLLDPAASVAEGQVVRARMARGDLAQRRATARRERVESADPKGQLLVGAAIVGLLVIVSALTGATVMWVITVVVGFASVVALLSSCHDADTRDAAARRQDGDAGPAAITPR